MLKEPSLKCGEFAEEGTRFGRGLYFKYKSVLQLLSNRPVEVWGGGMEGGICGQRVQWYRRILNLGSLE